LDLPDKAFVREFEGVVEAAVASSEVAGRRGVCLRDTFEVDDEGFHVAENGWLMGGDVEVEDAGNPVTEVWGWMES
jgi:hypothetical protein